MCGAKSNKNVVALAQNCSTNKIAVDHAPPKTYYIKTMTIAAAATWLENELQPTYGEVEAPKMAAMVMEHLTGWNDANRRLRRNEYLPGQQAQRLAEIHHRLMQHEPIQYVLEEAWFYDFKLYVNSAVLIPRPETEELVYWIVRDVTASGAPVLQHGTAQADQTNMLKILDVGTGSGCIALALKRRLPLAEVWACDASDAALTVARRNGAELDIRVDFVALDFLDAAQRHQLPTVDIIVSNPPYIPAGESAAMPRNVVEHEPHMALFVPNDDALLFYKAILQFATERLYKNGAVYLEIHEELGADVCALFENAGFTTELRKDMQGKDRMVKSYRRH